MTPSNQTAAVGGRRLVVRARLFRSPIVVLQVAEQVPYNYDPQHDPKPGGYSTRWRDARPEDVSAALQQAEAGDE